MRPTCFSATATLALLLKFVVLNGVLFECQANQFKIIQEYPFGHNFEDFQRFREAMQLSFFDNEAAMWRWETAGSR